MNYYVQGIATNYLKNVIDDPQSMKINSSFLYGIEKGQFQEGFIALLRLVRCLYADIAKDPSGFGMLLKENVIYDAKNVEYTHSNASFIRVPHLLLILGIKGTLQADLSLILDGSSLLTTAKELKITGLQLLLIKLCEYGFKMDGFGKVVKDSDRVYISYPSNPYLLVALKAMAEATLLLNKGDFTKSKNYFYMLHNGLLENETVKAPKLTEESIYHALDSEGRKIAAELHKTLAMLSKPTVRMGGFMRNDWSCVYTGNKSKKVIMSLQICQDKLSAKLNLQHIGEYIGKIMHYPENIRETIGSSGWECLHCRESCAGGFAFEMENKRYIKCRCGAFVFENLSAHELPYCKELLNNELAYENII